MLEYLNMAPKDWIMTIAVILGPILAVQAQKVIERIQRRKLSRSGLFKTLMATRAERLSLNHVQALNMIDLEYYGVKIFGIKFQSKNEKLIESSWRKYNKHLNSISDYKDKDAWIKNGNELFTKLLHNMSMSLGYDYDEVQLAQENYRPIAHQNLESKQLDALDGLVALLKGDNAMAITNVSLKANVMEKLASDMSRILSLKEAYILIGDNCENETLSKNRDLSTECNGGKLKLMNVEIRAVLDDALLNLSQDDNNYYGFIEGRRTWIVRDKVEQPSMFHGGLRPKDYRPALLSSRATSEIYVWVEQVTKFNIEQNLNQCDLNILRPLLRPICRNDRSAVMNKYHKFSNETLELIKKYKSIYDTENNPI